MKSACTLPSLLVLGFLMVPAASAQQVGKPAPPLDAKLLDGTSFSLASEIGKVVIVNFWATWCKPCRAEMPALNAYFLEHRAEGLVVLGISVQSDRKAVQKVMTAFSYPAALGSDASLNEYGRISRVPLTFVIDREGILRKKDWYGNPGIDRSLLEEVVTPLLQEKSVLPAAIENDFSTTSSHYAQ
jgi:peroxiredoxin